MAYANKVSPAPCGHPRRPRAGAKAGACACAVRREANVGTPGPGRTFPVVQAWPARARCRVCWGCCFCLRCLESLASAPAPIWEHTQVPSTVAGGRLGLPGRSVLAADGGLNPQNAAPRAAPGPPKVGGSRHPGTSASGPGLDRCLWVRCTPRPSWLSCCTSVCRCAVGWGALCLSLLGFYGEQDTASRLP